MADIPKVRFKYRCSFCGKGQEMVKRLIAGPGGVYICDECVALCQEIINEEQLPPSAPNEDPHWIATTRIQAERADKHEMSIPTPTACPLCNAERVLTEVNNGPRLVSRPAKFLMAPGKFTETWASVCLACGYTTFYAKDPEKLKP